MTQVEGGFYLKLSKCEWLKKEIPLLSGGQKRCASPDHENRSFDSGITATRRQIVEDFPRRSGIHETFHPLSSEKSRSR